MSRAAGTAEVQIRGGRGPTAKQQRVALSRGWQATKEPAGTAKTKGDTAGSSSSSTSSGGSDRLHTRLGAAPRKRSAVENGSGAKSDKGSRLLKAAAHGNHEVCRTLVDSDASLINFVDEDGMTAMHHAAKAGYVETVEALLELQFDDEARDRKGRTVLHVSAAEGQSEVIELLVDIGCDVDVRAEQSVKEWTPLMFAAAAGHTDAMGIFLHANVDTLDSKDSDGHTALEIAQRRNQMDSVDALEGAIEARRMRGKKERLAAANRRWGLLQRANTKRELRRSSRFHLGAMATPSNGTASNTPGARWGKLHKGFRQVSLAAGAIAQIMAQREGRNSRSSSDQEPGVRKSKSTGAMLSMLRWSGSERSNGAHVNVNV